MHPAPEGRQKWFLFNVFCRPFMALHAVACIRGLRRFAACAPAIFSRPSGTQSFETAPSRALEVGAPRGVFVQCRQVLRPELPVAAKSAGFAREDACGPGERTFRSASAVAIV
jgi:hypothetical protein